MSRGNGRRPSAATVIAAGALVLALVGSAIAGTPAKVGRLINGTDIKPRSQPANTIVKNGLTGKQIDEATLGKGATVKHATTATRAGNATSADTATTASNANSVGGETASDLKVRCRPNTTLIQGGCIETGAARTADTWQNADGSCPTSRTLPTVPQLLALHTADPSITDIEWSQTLFGSTTAFTVNMATGAVGTDLMTNTHPFRCIGPQLNF